MMSFNVWYGGNAIDFNQVGAAIRAADADVVGLQEPEANVREIANEAGLPYVDESLHLISRYPLYAAERDGIRFAYVAVDPGHVAAVTNVHLTCCPYGPHEDQGRRAGRERDRAGARGAAAGDQSRTSTRSPGSPTRGCRCS